MSSRPELNSNSDPLWYVERMPALHASVDAPDLVLLHGWGMSSEVWRGWLGLLRIRCNIILLDLPGFGRSSAQPNLSLDALLAQLKNYVPASAVLLGWSLGGAISLAFTQKYPDHCAALLTIASNPCFVANENWPHAMAAHDFELFQQSLIKNPQATLQRFLGLQVRGGDNERDLLRWLRKQAVANNFDVLAWGLNLLAQIDGRAALENSTLPAAHIFGSRDALVPVLVAQQVSQLAPTHFSILIDSAAHLPFVSHAELCWQHLDRLLATAKLLPRRPPMQREKKSVAQSFSRAASSYDSAAQLQRDVAEQLLLLIDISKGQSDFSTHSRILDIGCGTGVVSARYAQSHDVIGLDLAEGMLQFARANNAQSPSTWLCADAESLPIADATVDAVFSSLAVQWCENVGAVFFEIARVLRSGGTASISTLGPSTLHELRTAWSAVDKRVHVNQFAERTILEKAIARAGLTVDVWREEIRVLQYRELRELTRELKAIGAHNVNSARPDGLTSRERLQNFSAAYESQRDNAGLLPATYQVWYLALRKS